MSQFRVTLITSSVSHAPSCHSLTRPVCDGQYRRMNWKVLVTRRIPTEGLDLLRQSNIEVELHDEETPLPRSELLSQVRSCDGVMIGGGERVDVEFLDAAPKLKVISCIAVGYDNVDLAEATRRRIAVTNTPDVLTDAVADLTWALILGVARRVVEGDRSRPLRPMAAACHPRSSWRRCGGQDPRHCRGRSYRRGGGETRHWFFDAPLYISRAVRSPKWKRSAASA